MELEKEYYCLSKNELIFHKSINVDKNYQETIEEYLEDIFKVVKCSSHSFVTSCDIKNNNFYIYGKTEICLTYQNNQGDLLYTDFVEDFEESISINDATEFAFGIPIIKNKYCSYRIINQRRIDIHSCFAISCMVYDKKTSPCIKACNNSKLKKIEKDISFINDYTISKLDFDESFSIPSGSKGINRVVNYYSYSYITEMKMIKDKALIKGVIKFSALFSNTNNEIEKADYSFDFSKIVDISGIDENSYCVAKIVNANIFLKAKSSSDNTSGKIDIYGDLSLCVITIKSEKQEIVVDGYCLGRKCKNDYSSYKCSCNGKLINQNFDIKETFDLRNDILKICDLAINIKDTAIKHNKIGIELEVDIFGVNKDNEYQNVISTKSIELDFDYLESLHHNFYILDFDYVFSNNNEVTINAKICLDAFVCNEVEHKILNEMNIENDNINNPALSIYFAKEKEDIWDIAKSFSSDVELIMKENDLKNELLDSNKVIIVPGI